MVAFQGVNISVHPGVTNHDKSTKDPPLYRRAQKLQQSQPKAF